MVWEYSLPWQTKLVCDQTGIISGNPKPSSPSVPASPGMRLTPANLRRAGTGKGGGGNRGGGSTQGSAGAPQVQTATSRHTELAEPPFVITQPNRARTAAKEMLP